MLRLDSRARRPHPQAAGPTGARVPSAAMAAPCQYMRWSSLVEASFWQALADRKLDTLKLSEEPLPLAVQYRAAPATDDSPRAAMRFVVAPSALSPEGAAQPDPQAAAAPGQLFVFNRVETFKELNKGQLLAQTAQRVWDDIGSGAARADPSLLNRFALITFADLKTWKFYYWFCFPGLPVPSADGAQPTLAEPSRPASEAFDGPQLDVLQASIGKYRAAAGAQSVFVVALPGAPGPGHESDPQGDLQREACSVCSLASWEPAALAEAMRGTQTFVCVVDPCPLPDSPGWVLRNTLCMLATFYQLPQARVLCYKHDPRTGGIGHSLVLHVSLPSVAAAQPDAPLPCPKAVGWEMDDKGKPRPRKVDMGPVMDPRRMAETAVDLNLKLMRWRLMPALQVDRVAQTKCLLIGAGTLGCQVARSLLGWGVRTISLVDSGRVSFSNPVRQSLFDFNDCVDGGKPKAAAAAEHLREIFPGVTVRRISQRMVPCPQLIAVASCPAGRSARPLDPHARAPDASFCAGPNRRRRTEGGRADPGSRRHLPIDRHARESLAPFAACGGAWQADSHGSPNSGISWE